jgi:hypothetical protein
MAALTIIRLGLRSKAQFVAPPFDKAKVTVNADTLTREPNAYPAIGGASG